MMQLPLNLANKKTFFISTASILMLLCAVALCACALNGTQSQNDADPLSAKHFTGAAFERAGDPGYKLITSEIASLYTFQSLNICPSDGEFKEPWLYRITFDPKVLMPQGEEFVVLFGEENLSVNGICYVPAEGVSYEDILSWVRGKYEYFDYELLEK